MVKYSQNEGLRLSRVAALVQLRLLHFADRDHSESDTARLTNASPLFSAEEIKIPLLIGQGANDPRAKQAEAEQIVAAIAKHRGIAVYVLYSDEGHGFVRPENRLDFMAREEKFLADNLGGGFEPMEASGCPARPHRSASSAPISRRDRTAYSQSFHRPDVL